MNKLFKSIVATSVGVAMAIGVGTVASKEASPAYATAGSYTALGTATAGSGVLTWSVDSGAAMVTLNKASSSSNVYTSNTSFSTTTNSTVRWYVGNVLAITAENGYKIIGVKIVNSTSSSYYGGNYTASLSWEGGSNGLTADTTNINLTNCSSTTSGSTSTIEVKSSVGASALYVTTSKQSRPSSVSVKYIAEETNDPAFTIDKNSIELVIGGPSVTITATPNENVGGSANYSWSRTSGSDCVILANANTRAVTVTAKGDASASCILTISVTGCESKTVSVNVVKPLTVAEAIETINDANGSTIPNSYVEGIISQIDSYNETYHSIYYWISDDGTTTNQLEAYSGKGLNGVDFTSTANIEKGATVIIRGTLKKYGQTYEFDSNNYQISYTAPETVPATDITLDKIEMNVEVGFGRQLTAELNVGAHDPISWYSYDTSIATVVDGLVTGVSVDDVVITAFIDTNENGEPDNGELHDDCDVSVVEVLEYGDADNPLTVSEAKAVLDVYGEDETRLPVYITGIVSENGSYTTNNNPNYYNTAVWLEDGSEPRGFELFKATTSSAYSTQYSDEDSLAGKEVIAYGYGKIYGGTYELATSSRTPKNPTIIEVVEPAKTLSSIAVSGQTTSFTVGDTFVFGGTVTATYSDGSTENITSSALFNGYNMNSAGEQTVTVSYTEDGTTKTTEYTITVSEPAPVEQGYLLDGTVAGTGSTYDGDNTAVQNGISWIVNGNVTMNPWRIGGKSISGVNRFIYSQNPISNNVKRIDIEFGSASSITVNSLVVDVYSTAPNAESGEGDVTSTSANFEANSTVKINKPENKDWENCYYRITLNVTVTVTSNKFVEFKSAKFIYDESSIIPLTPEQQIESLNSYAKLSYNYEKSGDGFVQVLNNANTINNSEDTYSNWTCSGNQNIDYVGNSGGKFNSIQLRVSSGEQAKSGIVAKNSNSAILAKKVIVKWNSNNVSGRTIEVYGSNTAYTDVADLYGDNKGTKLGEIAFNDGYVVKGLTISENYQYIGLKSKSGAAYLDEIDIQWGTISYEYDDVAIRLGGAVDKDLWDELNGDQHDNIEGYGVLLSNKDYLDGTELKTLYNSANSDNFKKFDMALSTKAPVDGGDYYYWNLYKRVTEHLTTDYVAVAYIRTKTGVVFLQEVTASAKSLANDLINDKTCDLDSFEGSLANLACK